MGGKEWSPEDKNQWRHIKYSLNSNKRQIFDDDYERDDGGGDDNNGNNLTMEFSVENKNEKIRIEDIKPEHNQESMEKLTQLYPSVVIGLDEENRNHQILIFAGGKLLYCKEKEIGAIKWESIPNKPKTYTREKYGLQCYVLLNKTLEVGFGSEQGEILRGTEFGLAPYFQQFERKKL